MSDFVHICDLLSWWKSFNTWSPDIWAKNVGTESRKSWMDKFYSGFWYKYCRGIGLDIGYAGYEQNIHAILPEAIGVDTNFPGYDGKTLPFASESQDYVYSSHTLEHIEDYQNALKEWYRVTKVNGYIIIVVPHRDLYEKSLTLPSRWNSDHKRYYTPASLLKEIEESLEINTYRIRHVQDNDTGHNYDNPPEVHGRWEYECEVVIERIK